MTDEEVVELLDKRNEIDNVLQDFCSERCHCEGCPFNPDGDYCELYGS